jgi:hypothetical protein
MGATLAKRYNAIVVERGYMVVAKEQATTPRAAKGGAAAHSGDTSLDYLLTVRIIAVARHVVANVALVLIIVYGTPHNLALLSIQ